MIFIFFHFYTKIYNFFCSLNRGLVHLIWTQKKIIFLTFFHLFFYCFNHPFSEMDPNNNPFNTQNSSNYPFNTQNSSNYSFNYPNPNTYQHQNQSSNHQYPQNMPNCGFAPNFAMPSAVPNFIHIMEQCHIHLNHLLTVLPLKWEMKMFTMLGQLNFLNFLRKWLLVA